MVGDHITTLWTVCGGMGPEPIVALMDAILDGDEERMKAVQEDIESARMTQPAHPIMRSRPPTTPPRTLRVPPTPPATASSVPPGPRTTWRRTSGPRQLRAGQGMGEMRKKYIKAAV